MRSACRSRRVISSSAKSPAAAASTQENSLASPRRTERSRRKGSRSTVSATARSSNTGRLPTSLGCYSKSGAARDARLDDVDDDLPLRVSFAEVPESVGDFAQLVTLLHDGLHVSRFEKIPQGIQVRLVELGDEEDRLLAAAPRGQPHPGYVIERPEKATRLRCSDHDERPIWFQHAPISRPRLRPRDVQNQVVVLAASSEVLPRVVDHAIGTERSRLLDVPRAADSRYLCTERLRDLDCECAYPPGGAVDEDLLSRPKLPVVAQTLERGERCDRHGRRLLERQVRRLSRDFHRHGDVLGERSASALSAEDVVTRVKVGDVLADRFHRPREVAPG